MPLLLYSGKRKFDHRFPKTELSAVTHNPSHARFNIGVNIRLSQDRRTAHFMYGDTEYRRRSSDSASVGVHRWIMALLVGRPSGRPLPTLLSTLPPAAARNDDGPKAGAGLSLKEIRITHIPSPRWWIFLAERSVHHTGHFHRHSAAGVAYKCSHMQLWHLLQGLGAHSSESCSCFST
jgi:hypothetical protein